MRVRSLVMGVAAMATVSLFGGAGTALAGHGNMDQQENLSHLSNVAQTEPNENSDLAFWGNNVYAGNYDGFRIIDVSDRNSPQTLVNFPCRSVQNDVGVWDTGPEFGNKRLLFSSVDSPRADADCTDLVATDGVTPPQPPQTPHEGGPFEGLRIFDVTTPQTPIYLKAVNTDCGSHTHTVLPVRRSASDGSYKLDADNPDRVFVYVSSYPLAAVNQPGCVPPHNKISIVEVPFSNPAGANVLKEVPLIASTLGFPGQESQGCHDIGVFLELKIAAGACQGEGQIWDISDPANPDTMGAQRIYNEQINYFHSASFTWDGKYVIFGDEEGGAAITHGCLNASTGQGGTGAVWFYDRSTLGGSSLPNTAEAGSFTQTRQQFTTGGTICTTHNYNPVPVSPDRYLLTSAYYEAGTSLPDFTDLNNVEEVAYFDATGGDTDPTESSSNPTADTWSSYFYNGNIFANDINRGGDIFAPTGDAAAMVAGARTLDRFNPQTQECLILGPQDTGNDCRISSTANQKPPETDACTNRIAGDKHDNELDGTFASDRIRGKAGADRIKGRGGADCLRGGSGKDRIAGGAGDDEIRPGRGADRAGGGGGDDIINAARGGHDLVRCGAGDDVAVVNKNKDEVAKSCETVIKRDRADFATAAHLQSH